MVDVRRSYRLRHGVDTEKDAMTHQIRRIALDTETIVLLTEHKGRCAQRMREIEAELTVDMYVFTNARRFEPTTPCSPHLHALRHYAATGLLTAGVDLRTVAGRLGHGGGGATTLRATDRKAAEILGSRMPRRPAGDQRGRAVRGVRVRWAMGRRDVGRYGCDVQRCVTRRCPA